VRSRALVVSMATYQHQHRPAAASTGSELAKVESNLTLSIATDGPAPLSTKKSIT